MDMWEDEEERETEYLESLRNPEFLHNLSHLQRSRALVLAAGKPDAKLTLQILSEGAGTNEEDDFGYTPLMFASMHGMKDCLVEMLKQKGCRINKREQSMHTALHFAAKKGQVECTEMLLNNGAMVNVADDWGQTPLMMGVISGSTDTVKMLLMHRARLDMTDLHSMDALMYAAREGHKDIILLLIEHDADVNNVVKTSPLHQAALYGHVECVKVLLRAGAHPNLRDIHHIIPMTLATHTDKHEVVALLLQHESHRENINVAFAAAVKSNAIHCLEVLLANGASPRTADVQGVPAFFNAVALNHADVVKCLIRLNIDMDKTLSTEQLLNTELRDITDGLREPVVTPVMVAALRGYAFLIRILIEAGANPAPLVGLIISDLFPGSLVSADGTIKDFILERASSVRALSFMCRKIIRNSLGSKASCRVKALPLPKSLIEYVNFSDLDEIKVHGTRGIERGP